MVAEDQPFPRAGASHLSTTARQTDPHWQPLIDEVNTRARARVDDSEVPYRPLGRFGLEAFIARGGMGVVFKAHDPKLDRVIALKLWNCRDKDASTALIEEARCQAKVTHANVVTIYETGMIGDDVYLAMEYVESVDGRQWLDVRRHRPNWAVALALLNLAGAGLAAVHKRGLVHADFKPENLLFGDEGQVLVADFGIARVLDEHDNKRGDDDGPGTSGRGTKHYMAPERLERRWTDQRSDQFSFCVTLWEFVYGPRPFAGDTVKELLWSMARGPRTGDTAVPVPSTLHAIMLKGLALDPEDRFDSMDELLRELSRMPRVIGQRRRQRFVFTGWFVAMLLGGVGGMAIERNRGKGRANPHGSDEMSSESETTVQLVGDVSDVAEVTDSGEEGEIAEAKPVAEFVDDETSEAMQALLEAKYDAWAAATLLADLTGSDNEEQSLAAAQEFYDEAVELEKIDPDSALAAADYAEYISDWIARSNPTDAAKAQSLQELASSMVERLDPQSKHSTVPSALE